MDIYTHKHTPDVGGWGMAKRPCGVGSVSVRDGGTKVARGTMK